MKQIALRLPEEVYTEVSKRGEEMGCSANSLINILIHLGLKALDGKVILKET